RARGAAARSLRWRCFLAAEFSTHHARARARRGLRGAPVPTLPGRRVFPAERGARRPHRRAGPPHDAALRRRASRGSLHLSSRDSRREAIAGAVRGEHMIRYTEEVVPPRLAEALRQVEAEPSAAVLPLRRVSLPVVGAPPPVGEREPMLSAT